MRVSWLWGWLSHGNKANLLKAEEIRSADRRSELYTKLFEGQKSARALDDMVRRSLTLMEGRNK